MKDESGMPIGVLDFSKVPHIKPKAAYDKDARRGSSMADVNRRLALLQTEIDANGEMTSAQARAFVDRLREADRAK